MKKTILTALIAALAFFLAVIVLAFAAYFVLATPTTTTDPIILDYNVESGHGIGLIAPDLQAQGLIKNAWALRLLAYLKKSPTIQAGTHQLSSNDSLEEILRKLQQPPTQVIITILPGWRLEEIAEYLASLESLTAFNASEFLHLTQGLEGRLAPDTYHLAPASTTATIVNLLQQQFKVSVLENTDLQQKIKSSGKTFEEILIVASLLQREAKNFEQMRMIAAIIYSRLADNYPLELCASAQYAVGKNPQTNNWWDPPTLADTKVNSPFNTYVTTGLPPTPVCAVSLAAIEAAATPIANDYYFYLHDNSGQIHYALDYQQHQQNKSLYLQ